MTHPVRHADTGALCRTPNAALCEQAFPGVHHRPRHCKPVPARFGTSPIAYVGRRRKSQLELAQDALDATAVTR